MDRHRASQLLHVLIGLLLLAGGAIHLHLWQQQYRKLPSQIPGVWVVRPGFVIDAVASLVVAVAVVAIGRHWWVLVGALVFQLGAIAAVVTSHEASLFGWQEHDWTSGAKQSIAVEIAAAVVLGAALAVDHVHVTSPQGPGVAHA